MLYRIIRSTNASAYRLKSAGSKELSLGSRLLTSSFDIIPVVGLFKVLGLLLLALLGL
jgi:hypothetical protein